MPFVCVFVAKFLLPAGLVNVWQLIALHLYSDGYRLNKIKKFVFPLQVFFPWQKVVCKFVCTQASQS